MHYLTTNGRCTLLSTDFDHKLKQYKTILAMHTLVNENMLFLDPLNKRDMNNDLRITHTIINVGK